MATVFYASYPVEGSGGGGGGGVSSVGFADISTTPIYDVTGNPANPITSSGTLQITLVAQDENLVFAGPTTGSAAQPTFRSIVAADLPTGNLTDTGTDGITIGSGSGAVIGSGTTVSQHVADGSHNGYLSSTDWSTFNSKQAALTIGNLTDVGTDGITIGSGTGAVIGSGTTISQHVADSTHNGYLASADWSTFNGKQDSGNYITALTSDATASGPGSAALTLATVNTNTGSFGSSTAIPNFTVNGKGLITAAATNVVIAPAGTLTGTTLASNVVSSSLTSVGTITSGTWNGTVIDIADGGTNNGSLAVTAGGVLYTDGTKIVNVGAGTSTQVLTSNGASAPTWAAAGGTPVTSNYAQAYFAYPSQWVTTSASYVDGTNSNGNTLTQRVSNGITLTAGASNVCGITFTPATASSVYMVWASVNVYLSTINTGMAIKLTDGTSDISSSGGFSNGTSLIGQSITIGGIYVPGTGSPITVKLQIAANGVDAQIANTGYGIGSLVDWTVMQIA